MMKLNLLIAQCLIKTGHCDVALKYLYRALGNANRCCPSARSAVFMAINAVRQS